MNAGNSNRYKGKILLQFYSCKNFGDDMFVRVFAEQFPEYQIMLVCNPLQIPSDLPKNVYLAPFASWLISINKKVGKMLKPARKPLAWLNSKIIAFERKRVAASVIITGSIYMDFPSGDEKELEFAIDPSVERDFEISSNYQTCDGDFIVGANIGPIYHDNFVPWVESEISKLKHICLRDYASYMVLNNRSNVHYAPDVLFLTERDSVPENDTYRDKVLISVVNVDYKPINETSKSAYYRLIEDIIRNYGAENCCLVSFCKKEGDSLAMDRILNQFDEEEREKILCLEYDRNTQEMLEAFKSCRYVISTRFHSMILAAVFGKKFYPISYNCKIENYLNDLKFNGEYTTLHNIADVSVHSVMQNEGILDLYDNTDHFRYAENQFLVLRKYLREKEEQANG